MNYDERTVDQSVDFTCKSCAYYKDRAIYEAPCSTIAAKDDDKPCTRFMFNPNKWGKDKRVRVLQALSLLQDAHVSVTDLRAMFYSADRLPSSHPYGSRWWCVFGSEHDRQRICATVMGKNTAGKFTMVADNGAIIVVSGEALEPYVSGDVGATLAVFNSELPASMRRKAPERKPTVNAKTTKAGATMVKTRGDDEEEPTTIEFADVNTPKGKLVKKVTAKPAPRRSAQKSAKARR